MPYKRTLEQSPTFIEYANTDVAPRMHTFARTGFMSDFAVQRDYFDASIKADEEQRAAAAYHNRVIRAADRMTAVFEQRFDENPEIFGESRRPEILKLAWVMGYIAAVFAPTALSADVTFDSSVVVQAHYGSLHIYWEAMLGDNPPYAGLNVFNNGVLTHSSGGTLMQTAEQFSRTMTPHLLRFISQN